MPISLSATKQPHYFGHRERLRERLRRAGPGALQDHELLELVLTYAIARRDTKPLAKALIQKFGGLAGVLDAAPAQLQAVRGIGARSVGLLALFKPVCGAYLNRRLRGLNVLEHPRQVADYCRLALAGKSHEVVYALFADVKNRIIAERVLSEGTIDESPLYPRRLVEEALACHASGFILVHNHPSGAIEPSPADKALTKRVLDTAKAVDLRFLDHLIVGHEGYCSFRQEGLLN